MRLIGAMNPLELRYAQLCRRPPQHLIKCQSRCALDQSSNTWRFKYATDTQAPNILDATPSGNKTALR